MSYSYDRFLRPITSTDRNIQVLDNTGIIKYTINPFSVVDSMVSNNLLKINSKSGKVITINFSTSNEAKLALPRLQSQIDILKQKTPLVIDKEIKNYIDSISGSGSNGTSGTSGISGSSGISGGSYDYNNGLILSGLTVSLGGTFSQTVILSGDLNDLLFTGFDNLVFTSSVFDVVSGIISLDSNDSTQILSVNDVTINAGGQISLSGNSGLVSIGNTQGLVYQSDYKLGFVTHSLVDKGYVDFAVEGATKYRGTSSNQIVVPEPGYVVTFTTQTNLAYTPGETVIMYDTYPNLYMIDDYVEDSISGNIIGTVDLYDTLTGSMSVVVDYSESIGNTYSYWYINLSGKSGITTDNLSITNLNVSGTSSLTGHTILQYVSEVINPPIGATDSMVIYDFTGGNIWYHGTASTDYTANFINLPTDDNKVTTATIILPQDSIAYVPTIVQIDGTTQIVKWGGATAGNSNKVDIIGFTFIRTNSSWSQVLGNINSFS
jgi:hypothetical protein